MIKISKMYSGADYLGLTKREVEILRVLWRSDRPLTSKEILDASHNSTWAHSTIYAKLKTLVEKGVIEETGVIKAGNTISKQYVPTLTENCYYEVICNSFPEVIDIREMIFLLLEKTDLDVETVDKLMAILKNK